MDLDKALTGKRLEKDMQKRAGSIVTSFSHATRTGIESELEWIAQRMRENKGLLNSISSVLKNDTLRALLGEEIEASGELGVQRKKKLAGGDRKLRASMTKMKNLSDQKRPPE